MTKTEERVKRVDISIAKQLQRSIERNVRLVMALNECAKVCTCGECDLGLQVKEIVRKAINDNGG